MTNGNIIIENYVRFYRKQNDLTQAELAALIGKSDNTISLLECKNANPCFDTCLKLSRVFGLEIGDIFFEKGKAPDRKLALISNS